MDGGSQSNTPLQMPPDYCDPCHLWTPLHIYRGYLFVVDTKSSKMGLTCPVDPGEVTHLIRISCKAALEIICMEIFEESRSFCESLKESYLSPQRSIERSLQKLIFSDWNYCCIGAQPYRDQPTVCEGLYHYYKMNVGHWDWIVDLKKGMRGCTSRSLTQSKFEESIMLVDKFGLRS